MIFEFEAMEVRALTLAQTSLLDKMFIVTKGSYPGVTVYPKAHEAYLTNQTRINYLMHLANSEQRNETSD